MGSLPPAAVSAASLPASAPAGTAEAAAALKQARQGRAAIDRAVRFGRFSGWSLALFGGLSLLFALIGIDLAGLILGAALCGIAYLELSGSRSLEQLEDRGPTRLAQNQLLIAGVLAGWCVYRIAMTALGKGPYDDALGTDPAVGQILGNFDGVIRELTYVTYSVVAAIGVGAQVFAWRFHLRRVTMLQRFLAETPAWARDA